MGDYDGDGCCDAAISAPFDVNGSMAWNGKVYVYAGNTGLQDPTGIADESQTPAAETMRMYPNPLSQQNSVLQVNFPKQLSNELSTFEIYNIRGQKVISLSVSIDQKRSGSLTHDLSELSSGVYVCVLTCNKQQIKGKVTIIR
jgi:hypothetical protein